jgi:uncharacterized protein YndB with AHSA1/START domain
MTDFRIEVEIQAPPAQVWGVMRDLERRPEWIPTVTSLRLLERAPLAVGRAYSAVCSGTSCAG